MQPWLLPLKLLCLVSPALQGTLAVRVSDEQLDGQLQPYDDRDRRDYHEDPERAAARAYARARQEAEAAEAMRRMMRTTTTTTTQEPVCCPLNTNLFIRADVGGQTLEEENGKLGLEGSGERGLGQMWKIIQKPREDNKKNQGKQNPCEGPYYLQSWSGKFLEASGKKIELAGGNRSGDGEKQLFRFLDAGKKKVKIISNSKNFLTVDDNGGLVLEEERKRVNSLLEKVEERLGDDDDDDDGRDPNKLHYQYFTITNNDGREICHVGTTAAEAIAAASKGDCTKEAELKKEVDKLHAELEQERSGNKMKMKEMADTLKKTVEEEEQKKAEVKSMCSGWEPKDGPLEGKGQYCALWGKSKSWCWVEPDYQGPNHENFLMKAPEREYAGKFIALCSDLREDIEDEDKAGENASSSESFKPGDPASLCQWKGKPPFCKEDCPAGWSQNSTDKKGGDGKKCWTGTKKFCCPGAAELATALKKKESKQSSLLAKGAQGQKTMSDKLHEVQATAQANGITLSVEQLEKMQEKSDDKDDQSDTKKNSLLGTASAKQTSKPCPKDAAGLAKASANAIVAKAMAQAGGAKPDGGKGKGGDDDDDDDDDDDGDDDKKGKDGKGDKDKDKASDDEDNDTKDEDKHGCLGWAPDDGPWKGMGKSCDSYGQGRKWCWVGPGYTGSGHEFVQSAPAYPGKTWAPCTGPVDKDMPELMNMVKTGQHGADPNKGPGVAKDDEEKDSKDRSKPPSPEGNKTDEKDKAKDNPFAALEKAMEDAAGEEKQGTCPANFEASLRIECATKVGDSGEKKGPDGKKKDTKKPEERKKEEQECQKAGCCYQALGKATKGPDCFEKARCATKVDPSRRETCVPFLEHPGNDDQDLHAKGRACQSVGCCWQPGQNLEGKAGSTNENVPWCFKPKR